MPQFRTPFLLPALAMTLAAAGGCSTYAATKGPSVQPGAEATLYDGNGREAGHVRLISNSGMYDATVDVTGISPGSHGLHLHAIGKCDAPAFTTAGGHLNPAGKQHGTQNPQGPHLGDLPDVVVGADGKGHGSFMVHSGIADLFDADGTAIVVHAGPDDNKTDPSGNSGGRILCGVLKQIG
ncbi:MAG: superoxide dismutase family protein [Sphingobium sp.]